MTKPLVIYHANCADGFGAAWVCRKAYPDAEFHAAKYGSALPAFESVIGRDIIIVDFSYPRAWLLDLAAAANSVLVLDHHKSAAEALRQLPFAGTTNAEFWRSTLDDCQQSGIPHIGALFDMERSGAGIAWDFFFPGAPRPDLIRHIEDRDLFLFRLVGTAEIMAALFSHPYDFATWDRLMANPYGLLSKDGEAILRKQTRDIADLVPQVRRRMTIGGHWVPVANLPPTMASDAGHELAIGERFAACYWDTEEHRHFSLRSERGGTDVATVAGLYGGGGHATAAGFFVPRDHELARA